MNHFFVGFSLSPRSRPISASIAWSHTATTKAGRFQGRTITRRSANNSSPLAAKTETSRPIKLVFSVILKLEAPHGIYVTEGLINVIP